MYRVFVLFLLVPAAFGQPTLLINNAALPFVRDAPRIAPRSIIQVRLDPFADLLLGRPTPSTDLDLNQSLTLTIQPEESPELPVDILSATSFQILARLPDSLALGPATVTLTYNDGLVSSGIVEIVPASFALFADNQGTGPAVAQNVNPGSPIEINSLTRPALPGGYITLWGTGLGNTSQSDVVVFLDGREVQVQFAGPAPAGDGLDQINIFIPYDSEIANGCYIPLRVNVLGEPGNSVSVSKADSPGACDHPLGLSESQLQELDAGGTVPIGSIGISSTIGSSSAFLVEPFDDDLTRYEQAYASFAATDAAGVAWASRSAGVPTEGCRTNPTGGVLGVINVSHGIDVGETITASGPEGRALDLHTDRLGLPFYNGSLGPTAGVEDPAQLPPPFFVAGDWEIAAPGSTEAEAFRVAVSLPPQVEVTNFQELRSIDRAVGTTVTWDPEGYRESDWLQVGISSVEQIGDEPISSRRFVVLACHVPALAGAVTIGPELLEQFEASESGFLTSMTLSVNGPPAEDSRFTVTLTNGETFPGRISYGSSESFSIELR